MCQFSSFVSKFSNQSKKYIKTLSNTDQNQNCKEQDKNNQIWKHK